MTEQKRDRAPLTLATICIVIVILATAGYAGWWYYENRLPRVPKAISENQRKHFYVNGSVEAGGFMFLEEEEGSDILRVVTGPPKYPDILGYYMEEEVTQDTTMYFPITERDIRITHGLVSGLEDGAIRIGLSQESGDKGYWMIPSRPGHIYCVWIFKNGDSNQREARFFYLTENNEIQPLEAYYPEGF